MATWATAELAAFASDENLYIAIPNGDGSMHHPTWIWVAQAGSDLYVRAYRGTAGRWYQAAKAAGRGRISSGGVDKDVSFEFPTDGQTNDAVDKGYEQKYKGSPYLPPMLAEQARATTVRLVPAD